MTRNGLFAAALAALAGSGCGSSSEPIAFGALDGAIIAGQNQTVLAGEPRLPNGVTEQIVRMAQTATLRGRRVHPWERVFLPRLAWAQTVVNGSPVAGAVVCVYEGDTKLIPFTRCTNTGDDGKATFFFSPTTEAGAAIARINGTVKNGDKVEATTFDTVKATILPDVPNPNYRSGTLPYQCSPAVLPADAVQDKYGNAIPYRIVSDKHLTAKDLTVGSDGARTVAFMTPTDSVPTGGGSTVTVYIVTELRGKDDVIVGHLQYRIPMPTGSCPDGSNQLRIEARTGGSAVTF